MSVVIAYLLILIFASLFLWRNMRISWLLNPAVWFVLMQLRIFLGTIPFLDADRYEADTVYCYAMLSVLFCFVVGAEVKRALAAYPKDRFAKWRSGTIIVEQSPTLDFLFMVIVTTAIAISVAYYYSIGYNVFIDGMMELFRSGGYSDTWGGRRLKMYAGEIYFAPGYVNQFKNILLPLLCSYFLVVGKLLRQRARMFFGLSLIAPSFVFLTGTGQRGPLVFALIVIFIFVMNALPGKKLWVTMLLSLTGLIGFMALTLLLGRNLREISNINDAVQLLLTFPMRIMWDNQFCGIVGFRYIYSLDPCWGADWKDSFLSILPYVRIYDTIASRIHEIIYLSPHGTSPLSLVGSLWYNFHVFGVTFVAFLMGYIYESVFLRFFRKPRTTFRVLIYSAMAFILGSWCGGSIRTVFDNGLGTVVFLHFLGTFILRHFRAARRELIFPIRLRDKEKGFYDPV